MSPRTAELAVADGDRARLQQLGYKQELKRGLSLLSNFAFSFSIISVLAGVTTTYNTGLRYGGPASMTLGWLVVAAFNGCVALSMAGRSARPTRPPAASTTGAPSSPARTGRPSLPGSPDGSTSWARYTLCFTT